MFFRLFLIAALISAGVCYADPPSNDNFENRILLQGNSINFTGTLAGATLEDYDLLWSPEGLGNATVWWSWVAPDNTPVMVYCDQTSGLNNNGVVFWYANHDYTDLLSMRPTLPALAFPLRTSGGTSFKMFTPEGGKKYEVVLAGYSQGTFPLRLIATNAPVIFEQPVSQTAPAGDNVLFYVSAGGVLPLNYQWMENGVVLPGQTGPMLGLTNLTASAIGSYSVMVSNQSGGFVTSEPATLMLADDSFGPRLSVAAGSDVRNLQVSLEGETGRCYRIQSSTNLSDWSDWNFFPSDRLVSAAPLTSLVFTPNSLPLSITNDAVMRFFRAIPYLPVNEECNFNLKRIRLAKQFWARDHGRDPADTPVDTDWVPYLTDGNRPRCPSGGIYSPNSLSAWPQCSATGHLLEEPR